MLYAVYIFSLLPTHTQPRHHCPELAAAQGTRDPLATMSGCRAHPGPSHRAAAGPAASHQPLPASRGGQETPQGAPSWDGNGGSGTGVGVWRKVHQTLFCWRSQFSKTHSTYSSAFSSLKEAAGFSFFSCKRSSQCADQSGSPLASPWSRVLELPNGAVRNPELCRAGARFPLPHSLLHSPSQRPGPAVLEHPLIPGFAP